MLRIYLRELINLDNSNLKGQASVDHKTIKDIRRILPDYCKPCVIRKSIEIQLLIYLQHQLMIMYTF